MPIRLRKRPRILPAIALAAALGAGSGCSKSSANGGSAVNIDGSSTVFPITQAVAEEFANASDSDVTVGKSGTGGGFKKLCRGEVDLIGASRPVTESELDKCGQNDIEVIELPIAYDGIAVVVHPDNDWVESLSVDDLKTIWEPDAQEEITKWSDVRDGFPDRDLQLFGPGVDSGTYDYFTHAIVGTESASRGDFAPNEDDNVLVQGVSTDPGALGFFGFAYYAENTEILKIVPVGDEEGDEAVAPSAETISDGSYQPLTRPLFVYVSKKSAGRGPVVEFVEYFLDEGAPFVDQTGYVSLSGEAYDLAKQRFADQVTGSVFEGGSKIGVTAEDLLQGS